MPRDCAADHGRRKSIQSLHIKQKCGFFRPIRWISERFCRHNHMLDPMRWRLAIVLLTYLVSMSVAQEPKKPADEAGRDLRKMFLTMSAEKAGIQRSSEFPRVWAVAMDWPIGQQI